jgi:hypothetical protein
MLWFKLILIICIGQPVLHEDDETRAPTIADRGAVRHSDGCRRERQDVGGLRQDRTGRARVAANVAHQAPL